MKSPEAISSDHDAGPFIPIVEPQENVILRGNELTSPLVVSVEQGVSISRIIQSDPNEPRIHVKKQYDIIVCPYYEAVLVQTEIV